MKILWASPNSLFDTSNGAAQSVREILRQLARGGVEVRILSGTNFVNVNGAKPLKGCLGQLQASKGRFVDLRDAELTHRTLVTQGYRRRWMHSFEEQIWFDEYCRVLDDFDPDLVLFFDKSLITLLTCDEARRRNIRTAVYLAHPNNRGQRWCRDVDFMLTDSAATAAMYKEREGYDMHPIGKFVDSARYLATDRHPSTVLFINPSPEKGVGFVIQLALLLERLKPDIPIQVVESRSHWPEVLKAMTARWGDERSSLRNVERIAHTDDMRPLYAQARVRLVPSLWWESGSRVAVEALMNGIPVLASRSGGVPDVVGDGGLVLTFPPSHCAPPYDRAFPRALLEDAAGWIIRLFEDEAYYRQMSMRARAVFESRHDLEQNTARLVALLDGLLARTTPNRVAPVSSGSSRT